MSQSLKKTPSAGQLLISEPFLQDENFVRSVILICENNEKGSFGLVLNKLSILKISELVEDLFFLDLDVYVGGPVEQNTLHFVYSAEEALSGSIQLGEGLWWGGDFDALTQKLKNGELNNGNIRFFIGYSGWTEGQLDEELEDKTWIICEKIEPENIFNNSPVELWRNILKNMGGEFQLLANYPIDPRLN
jgi:putative transcriptional regulator